MRQHRDAQQPDAERVGDFLGDERVVRDYFHASLEQQGVVGGSLLFVRGDSVLAREHHFTAAEFERCNAVALAHSFLPREQIARVWPEGPAGDRS